MESKLQYGLDKDGCISLGSVLASYNAPINEDHAWALCHQCARFLQALISSQTPHAAPTTAVHQLSKCDLELVRIRCDGEVMLDITISSVVEFDDEFMGHENGEAEHTTGGYLTISQATSKVAVIIYKALDFGFLEEEERSLSIELESLLDRMVSADEPLMMKDGGRMKSFGLEDIIKACHRHWNHANFGSEPGGPDDEAPDLFYKQICKTLVMDALEFAKFLSITEQAAVALRTLCAYGEGCNCSDFSLGDQSGPYLRMVNNGGGQCVPPKVCSGNNFQKVAKAWLQVVREMRQGVKLRKLDVSQYDDHSEFEKTPYELLMDEIKCQRYHLRKVPEEELGKSRRGMGVHERIMEYVRSRPKLRKVSERVLRPIIKVRDPYEELMNSIKRADFHLRPITK